MAWFPKCFIYWDCAAGTCQQSVFSANHHSQHQSTNNRCLTTHRALARKLGFLCVLSIRFFPLSDRLPVYLLSVSSLFALPRTSLSFVRGGMGLTIQAVNRERRVLKFFLKSVGFGRCQPRHISTKDIFCIS